MTERYGLPFYNENFQPLKVSSSLVYKQEYEKFIRDAGLKEQVIKALITTDSKERKGLPFFSGVMKYFFLALLEVARVSKIGNDKHNPGQEMHWSRGKSDDHLDAAGRHMLDYASGTLTDPSGTLHLANAAWRILAQLQLDLEKANGIGQEGYIKDPVDVLRGLSSVRTVGAAENKPLR